MGKYSCYSYVLFARPSFLSGLARTLDMHGHFPAYNMSPTGRDADALAFLCDWMAIHQDFEDAWERMASEEPGFVEALSAAVKKDPYLRRKVSSLACKLDNVEVATQGT